MTFYCENCGEECKANAIDDSFDTGFGTEIRYHIESACCEAEVVDADGNPTSDDEVLEEIRRF